MGTLLLGTPNQGDEGIKYKKLPPHLGGFQCAEDAWIIDRSGTTQVLETWYNLLQMTRYKPDGTLVAWDEPQTVEIVR